MNQRVYARLNKPVKVGRRTFEIIAIDYAECPWDTGVPETMAFPAQLTKKNGYDVADWGELAVWYDKEPDFERYAKELGATIICKDERRY